MGEFIPLFPSILAVTTLGLEKKERRQLTKFILNKKDKFKKRAKDDVLFETSPMKLHTNQDMDSLMNKVASALGVALRNYGVDTKYLKLHITRSWANLNLKTTITSPHTHINSHLSVVYYPDESCNQATINFLRPNSENNWIPGISHPSYSSIGVFKTTEANAETLSYSPKEDICLIFPSSIAHSVSPNPSDRPRISIPWILFSLSENIKETNPCSLLRVTGVNFHFKLKERLETLDDKNDKPKFGSENLYPAAFKYSDLQSAYWLRS